MKKQVMACLLSVGLVTVLAASAMAEEPGPDVTICHVPAAIDTHVWVFPPNTYYFRFGKSETVGARAKANHLAHGDFGYYYLLTPTSKATFEGRGVKFEDWADCYFYTYSVN